MDSKQNIFHLGEFGDGLGACRQEVDNLQVAFERLMRHAPSSALCILQELTPLIRYEGWFDIGIAMCSDLVTEAPKLTRSERTELHTTRSLFYQELGRLAEARTELDAALAELSTEATAGQQQGLWLQNARLFMLERNLKT